VEGETELRDAQKKHHQDRQDDDELYERLTALVPESRPNLVCECVHSE
jgi:hypothetical protein